MRPLQTAHLRWPVGAAYMPPVPRSRDLQRFYLSLCFLNCLIILTSRYHSPLQLSSTSHAIRVYIRLSPRSFVQIVRFCYPAPHSLPKASLFLIIIAPSPLPIPSRIPQKHSAAPCPGFPLLPWQAHKITYYRACSHRQT